MTILPITLSAVAAAAVINIWLSIRIGELRHRLNIMLGDGGNELMQRRMRAHSNFNENAPIVLILLGAIEFARLGNPWLAYVAAIFTIGRVLHGFGMDGGRMEVGRGIGTIVTLLTQLGLAIWAVSIVLDM